MVQKTIDFCSTFVFITFSIKPKGDLSVGVTVGAVMV